MKVPETIKYDEPFEVNAAQLAMMKKFFGQRFAWRMSGKKILLKVWVNGPEIYKALKKLE